MKSLNYEVRHQLIVVGITIALIVVMGCTSEQPSESEHAKALPSTVEPAVEVKHSLVLPGRSDELIANDATENPAHA